MITYQYQFVADGGNIWNFEGNLFGNDQFINWNVAGGRNDYQKDSKAYDTGIKSWFYRDSKYYYEGGHEFEIVYDDKPSFITADLSFTGLLTLASRAFVWGEDGPPTLLYDRSSSYHGHIVGLDGAPVPAEIPLPATMPLLLTALLLMRLLGGKRSSYYRIA